MSTSMMAADTSSDRLTPWKASSILFSPRYKKVQLNAEIPTYYVGFLGKCEILDPSKIGQQDFRSKLVANICQCIRQENRQPRRVEMSISWHGIEIEDMKTGHENLIPIYLINRGMTDMTKPRIFAFISQNTDTNRMECHAFVTTKPQTSWAMTLCLKRSFELAYEAWKTEQKKKEKFYDDKFLSLAEDLLKSRNEEVKDVRNHSVDDNLAGENLCYSPRTTWTTFEEDLMATPKRGFSLKKAKTSFRRMPSVREVVGQPAVDNMFRQRQKLVSYASVFDVGDNEGLQKAAQDENVQILSLTGMDKEHKDLETSVDITDWATFD